jgi:endonuclease YncB( thermonuclease family)
VNSLRVPGIRVPGIRCPRNSSVPGIRPRNSCTRNSRNSSPEFPEFLRIADINTLETSEPECAEEAELGAAATGRLHALLNEGPFTLEAIDRDRDRYGRLLRTVTRDG